MKEMLVNLRNLQNWTPERFFYSHASKDSDITQKIQEALSKFNENYQMYIAEHRAVGRPLIDKLREEMLNCNALLLGWTKNAYDQSREIISFELGMAYSLGLPIYILDFQNSEKQEPWFFNKLTDYIDVSDESLEEIEKALRKIDPYSFLHPVDLLIPKERYCKYPGKGNQSENINVVSDDGSIKIKNGFDGILHFLLINNRLKSEKNVRLILTFPKQLKLGFSSGSLEENTGIQKNEIFDMRQTPPGTVRMYWPSLPIEKFIFEIRIKVENVTECNKDEFIECSVSTDNLVGWRNKKIPIILNEENHT
jgi:hypothetical protein